MPLSLAPDSSSAGWIRLRIVDGTFTYDISRYARSAEITRGRTSPLDSSVPAGICTLVLDDTRSTFDAENTAGPLYGHLEPEGTATLHVDVNVPELGGWKDLFTGGIESLDRTFTGGDYSECSAVFSDSTPELGRHIPKLGTIFPQQSTGARIAALIGGTSRSGWVWPSRSLGAATQFDVGQKVLGRVATDGNTSSWDLAVAAAGAELGLLFFNAAGTLVFSGQQDRLGSTIRWRLGDQAGQTPVEVDLAYRTSNDNKIRDAAITTTDGVTSIYGVGGFSSVTGQTTATADVTETSPLLSFNSGAAKAHAMYQSRSKARKNAQTVTLEASPVVGQWARSGTPTAYQVAVQSEISDLCQLTRTPYAGDQSVQTYWTEGIHHVITAEGTWTTTLNISRTDPLPSGGFWKLGVSKLGTGTVLTW